MMRLTPLMLALVIACPRLVQGDDASNPEPTQAVDPPAAYAITSDSAAAGPLPASTELILTEAVPAPTLIEPAVPTSTVFAELPETAAPTDTPAAEASPSPALTEAAPVWTATSVDTQTTSPTEEITAAPTNDGALLASATRVAALTATADVFTTPTLPALPTALLFPTVDLSVAITPPVTPLPAALTLPAWATMDDGASAWLGSRNWSLQAHDGGLAWVMTSTSSEVLRWLTPLDLRGVADPIVLSFQTWFAGSGRAVVQVSPDGLDWQPVIVVPPADHWTTIHADLSAWRGSVIQLEFVWQGTASAAPDDWAVDDVSVAAVPALPTASGLIPAETPASTPLPLLLPSALPTDAAVPGTAVPPASLAATAPESSPTPLASPLSSVNPPAPTAAPEGTSMVALTEDVLATLVPTADSTESVAVTAPAAARSVPAECAFDVDADGSVSEADLTALAARLLNTAVNETTAVYDLNGNQQIDIGDFQMLAASFDESCGDGEAGS